MINFHCPFCSEEIHFDGQLELRKPPQSDTGTGRSHGTIDMDLVTCIKCGRNANIYRLYWIQKGVKMDAKNQLRCPFCNVLFAEGSYSDKEQTFKCKNCKNLSRFVRINGIPREESGVKDM